MAPAGFWLRGDSVVMARAAMLLMAVVPVPVMLAPVAHAPGLLVKPLLLLRAEP